MRAIASITCTAGLLFSALALGQESVPPAAPAARQRPPRPPKPGVKEVQKPMDLIQPEAVFDAPGTPDWTIASPDAVWVTNGPKNTVHRMDSKTNTVTAVIEVGKRPCSGVAYGFGSIWVPNCVDKTISRVDIQENKVVATVPVGPAASEGGIACSAEACWMPTGQAGDKVARIDPKTNTVAAEIAVPEGSFTADFGEGAVWVTSTKGSVVSRIDPKTNEVTDTIQVGPNPRFMTVGEGYVWTLNQGDGTVSKVDPKTRKTIANIQVGIPGGGGEISAGGGSVWVTVFEIPISRIDAKTDKVTHQYAGPGGDAILFAHGSVWLSNLRQHNVWRIDLKKITGQ